MRRDRLEKMALESTKAKVGLVSAAQRDRLEKMAPECTMVKVVRTSRQASQ